MNRATIMLVAAVILWGTTIAPNKWALEGVHPFTLILIRLGLASLLMLPLAWTRWRRGNPHQPVRWRRLAALSFTGVAGYFLFNYYGIALTSGVNASILSASLPLFTLLLAGFWLKERITLPQWSGLMLGITGVLLISVQPDGANSSSRIGDILVLVSCLIWAVYVIQLKRPKGEEKLPSELVTALTLALGALMLLPAAAVEVAVFGWPSVTPKSVGSIAFLVVGPTILGYWLWNKGMEGVSAGSAGLYLNTLPLVSVVTAILLLGETVTWRTLVGGVLILTGVFWAERRRAAVITDLGKSGEMSKPG